jgi:hypothetical protein
MSFHIHYLKKVWSDVENVYNLCILHFHNNSIWLAPTERNEPKKRTERGRKRKMQDRKKKFEQTRGSHSLAHFNEPNRHHKKYKIHRVSPSWCQMQNRKHFRSGKTRGLNQRNGRQNAHSRQATAKTREHKLYIVLFLCVGIREKPLKHY